MKRRSAILWLGAGALAPLAQAQQRMPGDLALRVGMERLLVDTGFARALQRRFATDTGLSARPEAGPSTALLQALARGEIDIALTHAPAVAARLEAQGTIYDGRPVAESDFLLVGPRTATKNAVEHDAARALAQIAAAGTPFITLDDGSGTHLAEQALWRAAGVAPAAPWYRPADPTGGPLLVQARLAGACCLVDRATWLAPASRAAAHALAVRAEGDPRLATEFRVHRSLVAEHHAGKLFVDWLTGAPGRGLVAHTPGLRAPPT